MLSDMSTFPTSWQPFHLARGVAGDAGCCRTSSTTTRSLFSSSSLGSHRCVFHGPSEPSATIIQIGSTTAIRGGLVFSHSPLCVIEESSHPFLKTDNHYMMNELPDPLEVFFVVLFLRCTATG
ncbi:uncharacterized protein HKW66_Vig0126890 [Vigna angularis]|uniref:Uncharacterized protein n=1 Tax=Phaseolus angularis TaxID=3914 RepID=A0A8T0K356_PHAAN|nr:uncharacterized protein HKW66_Vig0126890 [Vigna angularis]